MMSAQTETSSAVTQAGVFPEKCLPPEDEYESREELLTAINTWAATRGFAFIARKSTTKSSGRRIVTYACDKSWKPKASTGKESKRKTTVRGTGCPFSILAKESLDKTRWILQHRPDELHSKHNHAPSHHPSAHPVHRQLDASGKATLSELVRAGISPRDIQTYLRQQNPASLATRQDIYNRIAKVKDDMHEGQSSIHALINQLDREGFWSRVRVDDDQRVTAILFAHPGSLHYLQSYSELLLLDCTYKTNKYQMPLLDMIGVDACRRSFCIAFAFLSGEQEEDYAWALERLRSLYEVCNAKLPSVVLSDRCVACLNAIDDVFPAAQSLLCLWHANRAVLAHCLPIFTLQEQLAAGIAADASRLAGRKSAKWAEFYNFWHSIMQSPTEAEFNKRVAAFDEKYLPLHAEEVAYIKKTWLQPYKEKLVKAWVDQHMHFGNAVTSRVEGIHALLKSYLKTSKFDLFDVWRTIKHAVENQLSEIRSTQARQQTRKPTEHLGGSLFSAVHGWVSHEAMRKVDEQRRLLEKTDPRVSMVCSGTFTKSHGLPCVHKIKQTLERNQALSIDDFHQQWHLKRNEGRHQLILEPIRVESRIQKASAMAKSSTQREPSMFEHVEGRSAPTCSRCHAVGHTRSSRICPLRQQEIILESSIPQLAEPRDVSLALAGWSAGAENGLACQLEETVCDTSCTGTKEVDQRLDHEVNEELNEDLGYVVSQRMDQKTDEGVLIHGTNETTHDRVEDMIVVQLTPRTLDSDLQTLPKSHDTNSSNREADAMTQRAPSDATIEEETLLPHYAPESIYRRYVLARQAWYDSQPRGSLKTNQA
ncbi:MULE transposase domain protein, partial [Metarhizium robertsii]